LLYSACEIVCGNKFAVAGSAVPVCLLSVVFHMATGAKGYEVRCWVGDVVFSVGGMQIHNVGSAASLALEDGAVFHAALFALIICVAQAIETELFPIAGVNNSYHNVSALPTETSLWYTKGVYDLIKRSA